MVCKYCGYNMSNGLRLCPKCSKMTGYRAREVEQSLQSVQSERNYSRTGKGFSDEEILALGLYPKDEGYKMSLISRILGRK